jgi:hypothetical protein
MRLSASRHRNALPLIALAVLVGLALAGCGGESSGSSREAGTPDTSAKTSLVDVSSAEELRTRFNQNAGVTRLLLLLSPT